jgi:hypothetical protein
MAHACVMKSVLCSPLLSVPTYIYVVGLQATSNHTIMEQQLYFRINFLACCVFPFQARTAILFPHQERGEQWGSQDRTLGRLSCASSTFGLFFILLLKICKRGLGGGEGGFIAFRAVAGARAPAVPVVDPPLYLSIYRHTRFSIFFL